MCRVVPNCAQYFRTCSLDSLDSNGFTKKQKKERLAVDVQKEMSRQGLLTTSEFSFRPRHGRGKSRDRGFSCPSQRGTRGCASDLYAEALIQLRHDFPVRQS